MTDQIGQLSTEFFEALMQAQPTWAHMLGDYRFAGSFEECSREAEDRDIAVLRGFADRAEAIDAETLDDQQRITRAVLSSTARTEADRLEARLSELGADPIFGVQVEMPLVLGMLNVPTADVADAMVSKLAGIGRHYEQLVERQREGLAHGRVSARFAVDQTVDQLEEALAVAPAEDALVTASAAPDGIDEQDWRARMAQAVEQHVRPAMAAYRDVLRADVRLQARPDDRCGLSWLDGGEDAYTRMLRYFTTTSRTARDIHETGLRQVESLAEEYRALGPEVVGSGDLDTIFEAMRTDPALHFETSGQLVDASVKAMAKAHAAMRDWFDVLPKAPCEVEGTTTGAKAFYFPPAADGSRGGTFFINTTEPEGWGTFELEAMAYHEGIPGHHLQLSIAAELPDSIPDFRKHVHNSAYAEGWGLYSERLAEEMGLYTTPVDRMGMLSADSMRACRLVVDTGIHAFGWSREQGVQYMVSNSPLTESVVRPEVDRYVVAPGQATSYMVGRLEIERMRREAEARTGFDLKRFHSAVLDSGSLPLDVLDEVVRARLG
ncbi:MAG: DUF885 domain-containing protein [Marmoricola sp.]